MSRASATANVLMMPNRDALLNVQLVVWGNTKFANGTAFDLNFGDGTANFAGLVADNSYIATTHTYTTKGLKIATLTVGAESETVVINVRDPADLSAFALRGIKVNMAIEDGLRYLYFSQFNRAATFNTNMTSWRSASNENHTNSFSNLATLAIQNHGHLVTNNPAKDIFQPVVQRSLNRMFDVLVTFSLLPCAEPAGNPCVGVPIDGNESVGLGATPGDGLDGYATPIFSGAIGAAASAAPGRTVDAGLGSANAGFVAGRTYAEILQRIANTVVWGQSDSGLGEGGWYYNLQVGSFSDGSTMGWSLLGLIDAGAAGATVPAFAKTEFAKTLANQINNNGSLDYQVDGDPTSTTSNVAKSGISIQGLAFTGVLQTDPRVTNALGYLTRNWNAAFDPIGFLCAGGFPSTLNKGCGYAMFNVFKGLRFYGIATLPGIGRPAGPGSIPADDWYADYVDNLLANQHAPTDLTRGEWSTAGAAPDGTGNSMGWSCCEDDTTGITALALLILSPVAFVTPSNLTLRPRTATNPVGTTHTVTVTATTGGGAPVPGATVTFSVVSGPNAGPIVCAETGNNTNVTDASGQASCTYKDIKGAGTDTIQASIGALTSNSVSKTWGAARPIPTLSEWAQIIMVGLFVLISFWALRRRSGRLGPA